METETKTRSDVRTASVVRALQANRVLNAELTLKDIVVAAGRIPGLGGAGPVSWELVTKDFVLRGPDPKSPGPRFSDKDVAALQASKIVNFDMTLGDLMEVSARLPGGGGTIAAWEFISPHFVLRGDGKADLQAEVVLQG